jgi:flagellar basal body-associated protein FliL
MKKTRDLIKKKMNSQQGASLMIALLFFLVCAIVGSVVLTAATVTSKRNSSANTDANRRRYAIMSAEDVITNQLKGSSDDEDPSVSFTQSWRFPVTYNDDDGSYTINTTDTSTPNISYIPIAFKQDPDQTAGQSTITGFTKIRSEMVNQIISHYWTVFSGSNGSNVTDHDPWEDVYPLTDWDQVISLTNSSKEYSVQTETDKPLKITLNNDKDFPTVYAEVNMDSSFNLTIHLYCTSGSSSKVKDLVKPDLYIVYNASDVDISYDSNLETSTSAEKNSTVKRSIQINITWDQPIITTDSSQLQSDT